MDKIDSMLYEQIVKNNTPAIHYVLFSKDSIIKTFSHGLIDIAGNKEVTGNTTYHAFSVTKTFTALAILQLAEQKKIKIEDRINKYLPDFPYPAEITIHQLLSHSAGIPNPIPLSWIHLVNEDASFDGKQFFRNIFAKNSKLKSKPNDTFSYSNPGYVLLGQLIEVITGTSFEEYVCHNIIEKIGLNKSQLGFKIEDNSVHAKGYHKKLSFFNLILGLFIDKRKYMDEPEGKWKPFKNYYINGSAYGGLIGTPDAFVRYVQELLKPGCRLLSDEYKRKLFTENFTNNNKPSGMCLSWFSGELYNHKYFSHAGGGGGYYSEVRIYPGANLGSVVFFNRTGMSDVRFLDKVDRIYFKSNVNKQ